MEKFKSDANGLQELLTKLYALSGLQLRQQAGSIVADFRSWLESNFDLQTTPNVEIE
ncbi:hypothetical protein [Pedobacter sp. Leaf41]|uniref:hypothetical protein n=1 Tax=Pedobacter sp. Leaf41 TaxID=1736218 RepID=UPI0012F97358|nr:hypothetical protein [Pedobacter sp. Leaf41]